jgi:hypothetical protein
VRPRAAHAWCIAIDILKAEITSEPWVWSGARRTLNLLPFRSPTRSQEIVAIARPAVPCIGTSIVPLNS